MVNIITDDREKFDFEYEVQFPKHTVKNHCVVINSDINVLTHPGFITEDIQITKYNNILIEISGRKGYSLTNRYATHLSKKLKMR